MIKHNSKESKKNYWPFFSFTTFLHLPQGTKKQESISKDISVQTMEQRQGTTTMQKDCEKDVLRLINKS